METRKKNKENRERTVRRERLLGSEKEMINCYEAIKDGWNKNIYLSAFFCGIAIIKEEYTWTIMLLIFMLISLFIRQHVINNEKELKDCSEVKRR